MPTPAGPNPLNVLLVDDHPDGGDSMAELLRLLGYEVRLARTGADAVALAESFAPDAAVLDLGLPDIDGFELARRLVAALARRPLLVALTGFSHTELAAREAGFDHHFLKPVDPAALAAVLAGLTREAPPV